MSRTPKYKVVVMAELLEPMGKTKPLPIFVWDDPLDAQYQVNRLREADPGSWYYTQIVEYEPEEAYAE